MVDVSNPNTDQSIPEKYNFYKYFGKVITSTFIYFRHEIKPYYKSITYQRSIPLSDYFDPINEHIEQYIPNWKLLKTYSHGKICHHTFAVIYAMLRDPDYWPLSKYDKNQLLWIVLFHDICKRGKPLLKAKDPAHPFMSALATILVFAKVFKFFELSKEQEDKVVSIFKEGIVIDKKTQLEIQDHKIMPDVQQFIEKELKVDNFVKEIVYQIMLHQSMPTMSEHPHCALLEPLETELPKYFDLRSYKLYRIFLRNDSKSYLLHSWNKTWENFGGQINGNWNKYLPYVESAEKKRLEAQQKSKLIKEADNGKKEQEVQSEQNGIKQEVAGE